MGFLKFGPVINTHAIVSLLPRKVCVYYYVAMVSSFHCLAMISILLPCNGFFTLLPRDGFFTSLLYNGSYIFLSCNSSFTSHYFTQLDETI